LPPAPTLTSPGSAGLFHRAIIQSGFALTDLPAGALYPGVHAVEWFGWQSSTEVEAAGAAAAAQLGCADPATALDCLRRVPVEDLVALSRPMPFAYGNSFLPEVPAQALREGRFHRVPIMSGSTRDEHRLFVGLFRVLAGRPVRPQEYPTLLAEAFGEHAAQVQAQYPLSAFESPSVAWATVLTDRMWARSTFEQHGLLADHVVTYAYEFADRQSPMYLPFPEDFPPGAFHAAGVPYLFNDEKFEAAATHEQRRLSGQMIHYWANFAHGGDPNGDALPPWSPFDRAEPVPHVQSLAPRTGGTKPVDYATEHRLEFWSRLPWRRVETPTRSRPQPRPPRWSA
jgi:para-nitrobenzyl esterase